MKTYIDKDGNRKMCRRSGVDRRKASDRRDGIRWEADKEDRRKIVDRRKHMIGGWNERSS